MKHLFATAILLFVYIGGSYGATVVTTTSGSDTILQGFDGINIGRIVYNVRFKDGSYSSTIGASGGLDFFSKADADLASYAILAAFDEVPRWDNHEAGYAQGITSTKQFADWRIYTPYNVTTGPYGRYYSSISREYSEDVIDTIAEAGGIYLNSGPSFSQQSTFADWNVQPVPLPAAVWLFGSGLLGLIGFSKRKKAA